MSERSTAGWVRYLELTGTVAVVISMLLVAYNVSRNVSVSKASNENFLYGIHEEIFADEATEPHLSEVMWRAETGQELSGVQHYQLKMHLRREINLWEIAFYRSIDGLMADGAWDDWDRAFSRRVVRLMPADMWAEIRTAYGEEFREHADRKFAAP